MERAVAAEGDETGEAKLFGFASGALSGIATVDRDIRLSPDGRSLTSDDDSEFRDLAGNLVGRRCASVTGARLD